MRYTRDARRGFTLVELIVVIGIIGLLAGIMLTSFGGGMESARAAKCLSNMRNLAQGAITYAVRNSVFPRAGSHPRFDKEEALYVGRPEGWISWLSRNGEYKEGRMDIVSLPSINACATAAAKDDEGTFAITNGALWKSVGQNRSVYLCPEHVRLASKYKVSVRFSYAMNAYFSYNVIPGRSVAISSRELNKIMADRILLFAELPFGVAGSDWDKANSTLPNDKPYAPGQNNPRLDCVLQCKANYNGKNYNQRWNGEAEAIAFNHKSGKRWCAHVVFADGHTEKLLLPNGGGGRLDAYQLTALLCDGVAVSFDGKGYSMPEGADNHVLKPSNKDVDWFNF